MQTDNDSHKRSQLHCHIPDKATGNCSVRKIMLTLRIILSLSERFIFFHRGLRLMLGGGGRRSMRQTFGCFFLLLNGRKMLIGVHVSKKTKGKCGGKGRSVHVRKAGISKREMCHLISPSWEGFFSKAAPGSRKSLSSGCGRNVAWLFF